MSNKDENVKQLRSRYNIPISNGTSFQITINMHF
nr:Csa1 family protein [Staphylococcus aureus]